MILGSMKKDVYLHDYIFGNYKFYWKGTAFLLAAISVDCKVLRRDAIVVLLIQKHLVMSPHKKKEPQIMESKKQISSKTWQVQATRLKRCPPTPSSAWSGHQDYGGQRPSDLATGAALEVGMGSMGLTGWLLKFLSLGWIGRSIEIMDISKEG